MNASNTIRYRTLAGTVLTQFALGSVYTWSLFNAQLSAKLSEPVSQVAFAFGLLSLALAVASSLAGKLQERFGVQRVTLGAGLMLGLGFFLTAQANNLVMLYLCAGVLVGLADGAGYLLTLSNCVKWFRNARAWCPPAPSALTAWATWASNTSIWRCWPASAWKPPLSCGA